MNNSGAEAPMRSWAGALGAMEAHQQRAAAQHWATLGLEQQ